MTENSGKDSHEYKKPSAICKFEDCKTHASFNLFGETKALYCSEHKLPDMVDVKNALCAHDGCKTRPTFNFSGETNALYCSEHKLPDMVDVKNALCAHDGCRTHPSFNFSGETKALYCLKHKLPDMINVISKICAHDGCRTHPNFNFSGETKALYCSEHQLPDMINIISKICVHDGCRTHPSFNFSGETKALYCSKHQLPDMVDVKNALCTHETCKTQATYGIPGQKISRCARHKTEGMMKNPSTKCKHKKCKNKALYGISKPIHCELHIEEGDENLCLQKCKSCSHIEICNKDGRCFEYCINSDLFKRHKHTKEIRIVKLLEKEIEEPFFCLDKTIDSSCNLKIPDIVYDCNTHFVVADIDENQHKTYQKDYEDTRMQAIAQACGMPVFFIRYNPDSYTDSKGKDGKATKYKREKLLVEWVKHAFTLTPKKRTKFIRIVYLYYDNFNQTDVKIQHLDV